MQIKSLTVGTLQTNCYLLIDEHTQHTAIIDPGDEADFITTIILENKLKPIAILLTHGHYDHCLGVLELQLNFNIPAYLHKDDYFLYQNAHLSAKRFSKITIPPLPKINSFLENNQIINIGDSKLKVIQTPGHTPGSCCFLASPSETYLFTGDTLFATGPGTAGHTYSSKSDLQKSLHYLQYTIQDLKSTVYIYPGHEDWGFTASQFLS